jgi:hypothetical protein
MRFYLNRCILGVECLRHVGCDMSIYFQFSAKKKYLTFIFSVFALLMVTMQNCSKTTFVEESIGLAPFCSETQIKNTEMTEQWDWFQLLDKTREQNLSDFDQVMSAPMVADLDGDKAPEIVFTTWNKNKEKVIAVLESADSSIVTAEDIQLFKQRASHSMQGVLRIVNGKTGVTKASIGSLDIAPKGDVSPLLIDLNNDGKVEIVYLHFTGRQLIALNYNGSLRWKYILPHTISQGVQGLNTFYKNGSAQVIVGPYIITEKLKRPTLAETLPGESIYSAVQQIPISLDGGKTLSLVDSARGVFKLDGTVQYLNNSSVGGNLGVGELIPEESGLEIAKIANGVMTVHSQTGALLKIVDLSKAPNQCADERIGGGVISVANFDGNTQGKMQMAVATGRSITITTADGQILGQFETRDCSSLSTGITTFDFDGDLKPEILYADEQYFRIFHLENGKLIEISKVINPNGTLNEYPVVADIRGDGSSSVLVVATNYVAINNPSWYENSIDQSKAVAVTGVRAFGAKKNKWMPARPIWNQYDFIPGAVNNKAQLNSYYNELGSDIVRRNILYQSGQEISCQNR